MLIVTRKVQESVLFEGIDRTDGCLQVTILQLGGGKVRLGVEVLRDSPVGLARPVPSAGLSTLRRLAPPSDDLLAPMRERAERS
jgi:hypothetical protein